MTDNVSPRRRPLKCNGFRRFSRVLLSDVKRHPYPRRGEASSEEAAMSREMFRL